jgi:hypothetical protein
MFAAMVHGWTLAMKGQAEEGIAIINENVTSTRLFSALTVLGPLFLSEAYGAASRPVEGLASLAEAEKAPQLRAFLGGSAEVHLVRARLLLLLGDNVAAEEILLQAITIARAREAKFLELLSVIELARLWTKQAKRAEAIELLTPIYGWFTEGLQTPVLKKAKALLDELCGARRESAVVQGAACSERQGSGPSPERLLRSCCAPRPNNRDGRKAAIRSGS